ncbi:hypothetical protein CWRG_00288 [Chthonomonas calidirosea]|uniref:hypothetical protein n=1 Tax=Chthonomonas calidirosea TaxID=454171 RepID=UPI0006DD48F8|nr:hypothetical protein [Chthonomonas calidirosea]CEK12958.1 hypothetical protein CWRG_00288 [Chthonomonas calidirosea]
MFYRNMVRLCVYLLPVLWFLGTPWARGQGIPFTIIRPPDGATVRENVAIEVPRASIPPEGYVGVYIDGKFTAAIYPQQNSDKPFTYIWATKDLGVSDGEHTVRLVLFGPAPDQASGSVQIGSTSIRVNVANIIHNGPSVLRLRYRFPEGFQYHYTRDSSSVIVGGFSETGSSSDVPLSSIESRLLFDIEQPLPEALVRDKLTALTVMQGGQQFIYPQDQLPDSVYQLLDALGRIHYEVDSNSVNIGSPPQGQLAAYQQGATASAQPSILELDALNLPTLPEAAVSVGETWITPEQRIDIPGLPSSDQPKVTLHSRLVDLEWQNGYPTAKIHQSFDSTTETAKLPETIMFNGIPIQKPKITYERDIYFAYTAGRVVKIVSTLTIKGDTPAQINNATANGLTTASYGVPYGGPGGMPAEGKYPGMPGGPYGMGGTSSPYSMGGAPYGGMPYGGAPYGGRRGGMRPGGPPVGGPSYGGGSSSPYGGYPGAPGGYPGAPGGYPGMPPYGGSSSPYGMGGRPPYAGGSSMPGVPGSSPYGAGGVLSPEQLHAITVRTSTITNLTSVSHS